MVRMLSDTVARNPTHGSATPVNGGAVQVTRVSLAAGRNIELIIIRLRRAATPAHDVDVTLPRRELGRTDVVFDVKADGITLGALHISRGAVVWFPAGHTYGHKLEWTKFAQLMESSGARLATR